VFLFSRFFFVFVIIDVAGRDSFFKRKSNLVLIQQVFERAVSQYDDIPSARKLTFFSEDK
jgi:hypothetical protein